jgi:hypothetical protein
MCSVLRFALLHLVIPAGRLLQNAIQAMLQGGLLQVEDVPQLLKTIPYKKE